MLEKLSQRAEQVATKASRREFLGWFGVAALSAAVAASEVLASAGGVGKRPRVVCTGGDPICIGALTGTTCDVQSRSGKCTAYKGTTTCYCG